MLTPESKKNQFKAKEFMLEIKSMDEQCSIATEQ